MSQILGASGGGSSGITVGTTTITSGTPGDVLYDNSGVVGERTATFGIVLGLEFVIDGGGSVLTTGVKGYLEIPFACTINRVTLLADQSGSVVVDIWMCTYAAFAPPTHPAVGDSITASDVPTITTATKSQDSTLTGWTTAIPAGDILAYNVVSVTTVTRVTVSLEVTRS